MGARDAVPLRGLLDSTRVALPAWRGGVPLGRFAGATGSQRVEMVPLRVPLLGDRDWARLPAPPQGAAWATQDPHKRPWLKRATKRLARTS